jgi:hypothetical protein
MATVGEKMLAAVPPPPEGSKDAEILDKYQAIMDSYKDEHGHRDEYKMTWTAELLATKLKTNIDEVKAAKTLDWGWKELIHIHAEALGDLLSMAENCVNLNMFVNEVGSEGGKAIARAMPHMKKLVQVDLQQWQIKPEGAKHVAEALRTHPRIKSIKMHYCHLGWEGTEYIARAAANHKTLTNLDLGDNGMDEEGARHIIAMLHTNTSLTRLDVSKNEGLVDNPEVLSWFKGEVQKACMTRPTPLNLICENNPGKKWHPNDKPPPPCREEEW